MWSNIFETGKEANKMWCKYSRPVEQSRNRLLVMLNHQVSVGCVRLPKSVTSGQKDAGQSDKPNAFEGPKMMYEEVFFLSVPFRCKHFDACWHFLSFKVIMYIFSILLVQQT